MSASSLIDDSLEQPSACEAAAAFPLKETCSPSLVSPSVICWLGYDKYGYDNKGYDKYGYDKYGYNKGGLYKFEDGKAATSGKKN